MKALSILIAAVSGVLLGQVPPLSLDLPYRAMAIDVGDQDGLPFFSRTPLFYRRSGRADCATAGVHALSREQHLTSARRGWTVTPGLRRDYAYKWTIRRNNAVVLKEAR